MSKVMNAGMSKAMIKTMCGVVMMVLVTGWMSAAVRAQTTSSSGAGGSGEGVKQDKAKPAKAAPPTLDELLGISKPGSGPAPGAAQADGKAPAKATEVGSGSKDDPTKADLDRLLSGAELGEAFEQAVTLMDDASRRLGGRGGGKSDAGIDTQRLQEDAIRKLDQLLKSMEQSQSSSSSKSKGSPEEGSKPRQQPSQPKPQGKSQAQGQQQSPGDGKAESMGPERQDGTLKPGLDSARAAWGGLPARVRDMLLQGSSDRFSSKYQALTEQYYKKLAEEKRSE